MNVCVECGNPLQDNETICITCRNRKISLNKMKEFQAQTFQVGQYLNDIPIYTNELETVKKWSYSSVAIWLVYAGIVSLALVLVAAILGAIIYPGLDIFTSESTEALGIYMMAMIFCSPSIAIPISIIQKEQYKFYQEKQNKINDLQNTLNQLQNGIPSIYENSNKFIPLQYCNPQTVSTLIGLVENHRADTLKEAINLYESLRAQGKLMEMQNQMLKSQQAMAVSSAISAVANTSTAYHTSRYYRR